jgi:hypothetical protein
LSAYHPDFRDAEGNPVRLDDLVYGTRDAGRFVGKSSVTITRWVQEGLFILDAELWYGLRPGTKRNTTVFHKPALRLIADVKNASCERSGSGWRPENWGRRKREFLDGVRPRPTRASREERTITPEKEAEFYGFDVSSDAVKLSDGLEAFEPIETTPNTSQKPKRRARTSQELGDRSRAMAPDDPRRKRAPRGAPKPIDWPRRRSVTGRDVKHVWPKYRNQHADYRLDHDGQNPTVYEWSKIVGMDPDDCLAFLQSERVRFRSHIPKPPKEKVKIR